MAITDLLQMMKNEPTRWFGYIDIKEKLPKISDSSVRGNINKLIKNLERGLISCVVFKIEYDLTSYKGRYKKIYLKWGDKHENK